MFILMREKFSRERKNSKLVARLKRRKKFQKRSGFNFVSISRNGRGGGKQHLTGRGLQEGLEGEHAVVGYRQDCQGGKSGRVLGQ